MKPIFRTEKLNEKIKVVNTETGEIRNAEMYRVWTIDIKDENDFYQMYANGVLAVLGLKPNFCIHVFSFICMKADTNGLVNITGPLRTELKELTGLSEASIVKALKELIDKNIIEKDSRGWYRINPNYAWKGSQVQRSKLLKNSKCVVKIEILPNEKVMK